MDNVAMQSIIQQMRSAANVAAGETTAGAQNTSAPAFSETLGQALQQVNQLQSNASELATRFELGDPDVSLPQVMISLEKSSVAFEATRQVRNRLVSAYKEVMNMPI